MSHCDIRMWSLTSELDQGVTLECLNASASRHSDPREDGPWLDSCRNELCSYRSC
jgi:hypothetical protein